MNLADESLKQLNDPSLTEDERASLRCDVAADLMQRGQYEVAREALGELWQGLGERPNLEALEGRTAAEVLLQAGALSGWMGASRQVAGAQDAAKDLISEGVRIFERFGETARAALARSELALCYWREGAYDDARALLTNSFEKVKKYAVEAVRELKEAGEWKRDEERINYRCGCDSRTKRKALRLPAEVTFILRGEMLETFSINFEMRRGRGKRVGRDNVEEIKQKIMSYFEARDV